MYSWLGMRKLSWEEVQELYKNNELGGCYFLYDDGSEGQIEQDYSWEDILRHHDYGGEFGIELQRVDLQLADGKPIKAPVVINISSLGCLDELEYSLWNTIQEYMELFGITTEDEEPDWATVKAVQDKIIGVLMDAGVSFKILTDEQSEAIEKELEKKQEEKIEKDIMIGGRSKEDKLYVLHGYWNTENADGVEIVSISYDIEKLKQKLSEIAENKASDYVSVSYDLEIVELTDRVLEMKDEVLAGTYVKFYIKEVVGYEQQLN